MRLDLDHVPFAVAGLDTARQGFADLGLETVYGGEHDNGVTHMALAGFADRSYVELIARHDTERDSPYWPRFVHEGAGPCAWCVRVEDVHAATARLIERGSGVSGPWNDGRERPDGTPIEWDATFLGRERWRNALPFLITDRTPIERRVPVTVGEETGLRGIERVVVAVSEIETASERFRRLFRFPRPERDESERLGAELAVFPGTPLVLAEPARAGYIADRLDGLPDAPCSCLLGVDDFEGTLHRFPLSDAERWGDRRVAWFESEPFSGGLGVIER
ncbi:VOC family protein [Natronorarus salvus]|uniref:VOC family protein n=1 Tax=Natronorarus salvus TaxID=3117733 RepID=UPI002F26D79C